jgi:hypothetical protein
MRSHFQPRRFGVSTITSVGGMTFILLSLSDLENEGHAQISHKAAGEFASLPTKFATLFEPGGLTPFAPDLTPSARQTHTGGPAADPTGSSLRSRRALRELCAATVPRYRKFADTGKSLKKT